MPPHQENEGFRGCVGEDHICHEGRKEHWERAAGEQCEEPDQRGLLSKQPVTGRRPRANCQVVSVSAGDHHSNRGNGKTNRAFKHLMCFTSRWHEGAEGGAVSAQLDTKLTDEFWISVIVRFLCLGWRLIRLTEPFLSKMKQHHMVLVYKEHPCHLRIWKC